MSTITKQWLQQKIADMEAARDEIPFGLGEDDSNTLAALRIALASLEAEAVGEVVLGEYDDCGCHPDARVVCIAADGQADWENFKDGTRLYAAPPSLVEIDEREAFNAWNNDENLPIAGVGAKNAAWLAWQARAAMLQSSQPVSNRDELPLYYLQGHKDGLEWAAQLAEANHPQTGDWLYDDPIELAKAIRKGPDMPEADGNSPVIPDDVLSAVMKVASIRADFDDFDGDRRGIGDCLDEAEQDLIVTINKHASVIAAAPQQEAE